VTDRLPRAETVPCAKCAKPLSEVDLLLSEELGFVLPLHGWHEDAAKAMIGWLEQRRDEKRDRRNRLYRGDPEWSRLSVEANEFDGIISRFREIRRLADQAEHPTAQREAWALVAELRELCEPDGAKPKRERFDLRRCVGAEDEIEEP
jgi:hypothetical protein